MFSVSCEKEVKVANILESSKTGVSRSSTSMSMMKSNASSRARVIFVKDSHVVWLPFGGRTCR